MFNSVSAKLIIYIFKCRCKPVFPSLSEYFFLMLVLLRFLTTFYGLYFSSMSHMLQIAIWASEGCFHVLYPSCPCDLWALLLLLTANIKACIISPKGPGALHLWICNKVFRLLNDWYTILDGIWSTGRRNEDLCEHCLAFTP